jgi:general secretion pathway protein J
MRINHSGAGFTLLEILLAISILSILVVILISGLHVGIKSWEKGEERIDESQTTRIVQDLIFQDIRSCYPYQIAFENKRTLVFQGESDRIDFIATSASFVSQSRDVGLREVSYYIDDDPSTDQEGLVVREAMVTQKEDVFSDERGTIIELDNHVKSIKFRYFIANDSLKIAESGLENGQWLDRWDSLTSSLEYSPEVSDDELAAQIESYKQKYFPRAVEVTLEIETSEGNKTELVSLPPLIIPVQTGQHFTNPHLIR